MCIATCILRLTEDLLQEMFQKIRPKISIDNNQLEPTIHTPSKLEDICVIQIQKTLPEIEKHMCDDLLKQTCRSPDGLKHQCIEALKVYIPNYSKELVERLTHRVVIRNPDKLKQLCLQKM